jgi:hypothetical protein
MDQTQFIKYDSKPILKGSLVASLPRDSIQLIKKYYGLKWAEKNYHKFDPSVKKQIITVLISHRRPDNQFNKLPVELIYEIFHHLVIDGTHGSIYQSTGQFAGEPRFGGSYMFEMNKEYFAQTKMWIRICLSGRTLHEKKGKWCWVGHIENAILKKIKFSLGNQTIDCTDNHWSFIRNQLETKQSKIKYDDSLKLSDDHDDLFLSIPVNMASSAENEYPLFIQKFERMLCRYVVDFATADELVCTTGDLVASDLGLKIKECYVVNDFLTSPVDDNQIFVNPPNGIKIGETMYNDADIPCKIDYRIPVGCTECVRFNDSDANKFKLDFSNKSKFMVIVTQPVKWTDGSKFLAYDCDDREVMIEWATKRALILYGRTSNVNNGLIELDIGGRVISGHTDKPIHDTMIHDVIVNNLLTIRECSEPIIDDMYFGIHLSNKSHPEQQNIVTVHMPCNYGLYIDESVNPIQNLRLSFNDVEYTRAGGTHYNYTVPYLSFNYMPNAGINLITFDDCPFDITKESIANLSRIDKQIVDVTMTMNQKYNVMFYNYHNNNFMYTDQQCIYLEYDVL